MTLNHWILFASGAISALLVSTTYDAPLIAQTTPEDDLPHLLPHLPAVVEASEATSIPQISPDLQIDTPEVAQSPIERAPAMTMPLAASSVSVQLINDTSEAIIYEALGDTEPRTLAAGKDVTLQSLSVPATVTFSYETTSRDRQTGTGLTKAELTAESNDSLLKLVVQPTTDLDSEVSNLTVESNGNVFVF
ncbi:MAG: hypothetical protein AAF810_26300 [Cyanobacteria bacterium P01_D01_bin.36]